MCPSAKASCSKRWFSSFAAVWRLKSFVFPKPTSKTSEFICSLPDYPNVSVAIPWNSLPADTDFSLTLKVFIPDVAFVRNNNDDDMMMVIVMMKFIAIIIVIINIIITLSIICFKRLKW